MLDGLEKLSKIVFAGVASAVVAVAGLNVEWQKLGLEEDNWCFEHADRVQVALLQQTETIPDFLISRYAERCDVSLQQAARVLHEDKVLAELSRDQSTPTEYAYVYQENVEVLNQKSTEQGGDTGSSPDVQDPDAGAVTNPDLAYDGYVALGRTQPSAYSHVNFDIAGDGQPSISDGAPPQPGTLIKARWSVNLREDITNTTISKNPVLSVVDEGQCLEVEDEPQAIRGQYWAAVARADCPS